MRRHHRVAIVIGLIFGVAVWLQAPSVFADTGGYPYAAKPCIWAPYAAQGSGAQWCPDYDFGDSPNNQSAANVLSPYGYYYRNCTDYAAWKLNAMGIDASLYKGLGNAKDWAAHAGAKGIRIDASPAVGAIGVRTTGTYGHTAYVESIHDDGTLTLSHYNYKGDGNYSVEQGTASASAFGLAVFIHFEDYLPASIVTGVTAEPVPPITEPEVAPAEVAPALAPAPDSPVIEEVPVEAVESQTTVTPSAEVVAPTPEVAPALVTAPASLPPVPAAMPVTPQPAPPPVPTTPIWQQAASSPPSVRLTDVKPLSTAVAVRTEPTPMYIATYWPLLGLVGALIAQGATTRRIKIVS